MKTIEHIYNKLITFHEIEELSKIIVKNECIQLQNIIKPIIIAAFKLLPNIEYKIRKILDVQNNSYKFILNIKDESSILFKMVSGYCYSNKSTKIALISEVHDIIRGRIICNEIQECYLITESILSNFGLCNRLWNTISNGNTDNDYASIDFNILIDKVVFQIQVRTISMDKSALTNEGLRKDRQVENFRKTITNEEHTQDFKIWLKKVIGNLIYGFQKYRYTPDLGYNDLLSLYSNGINDIPPIRFLKSRKINKKIIKKSISLWY